MRNIQPAKTPGNRLQKRMYCVIAAIVMGAIIFIGGKIHSFTNPNGTKKNVYKYYTSISIKKGDTLWSIANEYMTEEYDGIEEYILEVRRLNHLCGDGIYAGAYLMIPRYAADSP